MFTGLVAGTGTVERAGEALRISTTLAGELSEGDSVAVNGVCLTATEAGPDHFVADVMQETLELPLRAADRLGGHIVQGHVDGVGEVESVREEGSARVLRIAADSELLRYVVEKGSIAVDGVSLTVASVDHDGFVVSLIPETLTRTTLGSAGPGHPVNLEVDLLAKYVEKLTAVRA
jgi:riboflavin synthase